jgi:hypothetical protein
LRNRLVERRDCDDSAGGNWVSRTGLRNHKGCRAKSCPQKRGMAARMSLSPADVKKNLDILCKCLIFIVEVILPIVLAAL